MEDPSDEVAGRGLAMLRAAGIAVDVGLMERAAEALNAGFISRVTRGRPFVRLKMAASLDGATAMQAVKASGSPARSAPRRAGNAGALRRDPDRHRHRAGR